MPFISRDNSKSSFPCVKNQHTDDESVVLQKPLTRESHEFNERKSRI